MLYEVYMGSFLLSPVFVCLFLLTRKYGTWNSLAKDNQENNMTLQPFLRGKMNDSIKSKLALLVSLVAVLVLLAGSRSFAQDTAPVTAAAIEVMQTLEPDQLQVMQPA